MDGLFDGILYSLGAVPFFFIALGVFSGIVVGAIPGLTSTMLIALTLPLTFFMDSKHALLLLVAMYVGGVSGGLISATLLRMPGTPASIMTTLDGYPMAKAGRPGRALGLAIGASLFGGLASWVVLVLLSPPLARLALTFGPWEFFTLVLMAIVLIASISQGSFIRGLLAGFLGILAAMPGIDPSTGNLRLTFGFAEMAGGFSLLPVVVGIFVISQIVKDVLDIDQRPEGIEPAGSGIFMSLRDWSRQAVNLVRSSLVGTWVGILPGIGSSIGSIMSYTVARNFSREREKFGTGFDDGIIASEAGNNATVGGALIPLITLGIPGSSVDAILLGALIIHNLQPGPLLFTTNPDIVWAIIGSFLIANLLMFVMMTGLVRHIAKLMTVPKSLLLPVVLMFCAIGTFAIHNRIFDVWVALAFGLLGFFMDRCKVPLGPFVIGFVLAPIAEEELRAGLMLSDGSWLPLIERPIAGTLFALSILFFLWPFAHEWWTRRRAKQAAAT